MKAEGTLEERLIGADTPTSISYRLGEYLKEHITAQLKLKQHKKNYQVKEKYNHTGDWKAVHHLYRNNVLAVFGVGKIGKVCCYVTHPQKRIIADIYVSDELLGNLLLNEQIGKRICGTLERNNPSMQQAAFSGGDITIHYPLSMRRNIREEDKCFHFTVAS